MGNPFELYPGASSGLRSSKDKPSDETNIFQSDSKNIIVNSLKDEFDIGMYSTICWVQIRTVTKYTNGSEPLVIDEYAISFETPSDIPKKYLENIQTNNFDRHIKKSVVVPAVVTKRTDTEVVIEHKNITCASGPLYTREISIFPEKNKKRLEIKVSPKRNSLSIDCDKTSQTSIPISTRLLSDDELVGTTTDKIENKEDDITTTMKIVRKMMDNLKSTSHPDQTTKIIDGVKKVVTSQTTPKPVEEITQRSSRIPISTTESWESTGRTDESEKIINYLTKLIEDPSNHTLSPDDSKYVSDSEQMRETDQLIEHLTKIIDEQKIKHGISTKITTETTDVVAESRTLPVGTEENTTTDDEEDCEEEEKEAKLHATVNPFVNKTNQEIKDLAHNILTEAKKKKPNIDVLKPLEPIDSNPEKQNLVENITMEILHDLFTNQTTTKMPLVDRNFTESTKIDRLVTTISPKAGDKVIRVIEDVLKKKTPKKTYKHTTVTTGKTTKKYEPLESESSSSEISEEFLSEIPDDVGHTIEPVTILRHEIRKKPKFHDTDTSTIESSTQKTLKDVDEDEETTEYEEEISEKNTKQHTTTSKNKHSKIIRKGKKKYKSKTPVESSQEKPVGSEEETSEAPIYAASFGPNRKSYQPATTLSTKTTARSEVGDTSHTEIHSSLPTTVDTKMAKSIEEIAPRITSLTDLTVNTVPPIVDDKNDASEVESVEYPENDSSETRKALKTGRKKGSKENTTKSDEYKTEEVTEVAKGSEEGQGKTMNDKDENISTTSRTNATDRNSIITATDTTASPSKTDIAGTSGKYDVTGATRSIGTTGTTVDTPDEESEEYWPDDEEKHMKHGKERPSATASTVKTATGRTSKISQSTSETPSDDESEESEEITEMIKSSEEATKKSILEKKKKRKNVRTVKKVTTPKLPSTETRRKSFPSDAISKQKGTSPPVPQIYLKTTTVSPRKRHRKIISTAPTMTTTGSLKFHDEVITFTDDASKEEVTTKKWEKGSAEENEEDTTIPPFVDDDGISIATRLDNYEEEGITIIPISVEEVQEQTKVPPYPEEEKVDSVQNTRITSTELEHVDVTEMPKRNDTDTSISTRLDAHEEEEGITIPPFVENEDEKEESQTEISKDGTNTTKKPRKWKRIHIRRKKPKNGKPAKSEVISEETMDENSTRRRKIDSTGTESTTTTFSESTIVTTTEIPKSDIVNINDYYSGVDVGSVSYSGVGDITTLLYDETSEISTMLGELGSKSKIRKNKIKKNRKKHPKEGVDLTTERKKLIEEMTRKIKEKNEEMKTVNYDELSQMTTTESPFYLETTQPDKRKAQLEFIKELIRDLEKAETTIPPDYLSSSAPHMIAKGKTKGPSGETVCYSVGKHVRQTSCPKNTANLPLIEDIRNNKPITTMTPYLLKVNKLEKLLDILCMKKLNKLREQLDRNSKPKRTKSRRIRRQAMSLLERLKRIRRYAEDLEKYSIFA